MAAKILLVEDNGMGQALGGCDDFDIKPIDLDRLPGKIEALLEGKAKT
jgi:hypothetical protein